MYRIAIFKIQPEPDSTGYQTNYLAGTGYLDTYCIIVNFLVYFVVRIKMYYSLCLCAHTLHKSTTNICKTVGLHDSLVFLKFKCTHSSIALQYGTHSLGELSSTNCQKGPSTIRLRCPVPSTVLAGARTGFKKWPDIRHIPTSYFLDYRHPVS